MGLNLDLSFRLKETEKRKPHGFYEDILLAFNFIKSL